MILPWLLVGWLSAVQIADSVRVPAWYETGRPPEGCFFLVQFPRRAWLVLPARRTNAVFCWHESQLLQKEP